MELFTQNLLLLKVNIVLCLLVLVQKLLEREPLPAPVFYVHPEVKDFYKFTVDDFRLENYRFHEFREKIPVAI